MKASKKELAKIKKMKAPAIAEEKKKLKLSKKAIVAISVTAGVLATAGIVTACVFLTPDENKNTTEEVNWDSLASYDVELSQSYEITKPGIYHLTGEIKDGILTIETSGNVKLILDNVVIANSEGPAILVKNAKNTKLELIGENKLADGKTYNGYEDEVGVIFSHDDLFFEGDGTLEIIANNEDGIVSKDDLEILSGNYKITSADDAIRGKDSVTIKSGAFEISAGGDGIKSTNDSNEDKGYILIEDGKFTISANNQGLQAAGDLTIKDGEINITKSEEGLEGKVINIDGGKINIIASDDGINATDKSGSGMMAPGRGQQMNNPGVAIYIRGGKITVDAGGDGIDSNGNIYVEGGETIVYGPTNSADGALDYDGECIISGGTVIAGGASGMAEGFSTNSTIYSVEIGFEQKPSGEVTIETSDGTKVISYKSNKSYDSLVIASPKLEKGKSYNIKVAGETLESFTISEIVTKVGKTGGGFGLGRPGGMMNEMPSNKGERPMGDFGFDGRGQMMH